MTTDAAHDAPPPWPAVVIEVVASLVATGAVVLIFLNYVGAHLTFFGDPVSIDQQEVNAYWMLVATLAASVVATSAAAAWRGARRAFAWHVAVAVAGVLVAVAFPVTEAGPVREPAQVEPADPYVGPVCRSGGDSNECVGG